MWISNLKLENIKSFHKLDIDLSRKINIFIGENNSGKSTILQTIYLLQEEKIIELEDLRKSEHKGSVSFKPEYLNDDQIKAPFIPYGANDVMSFSIEFDRYDKDKSIRRRIYKSTSPQAILRENASTANKIRPHNLIYTHLSDKKTAQYEKSVGTEHSQKIFKSYAPLPIMMDAILARRHPYRESFESLCESILKFPPDSFNIPGGKGTGILLNANEYISIEKMGQGVAPILALIYDLCHAKDQIFLIEELENDLHPQALKKLLNEIIKVSDQNQFFISTHSNIVTKILGSVPDAKIFEVANALSVNHRLPYSTCVELESTEERINVLEKLGYELSDYDLWKAWLILEESSAERIIRDFLIPNFTPGLIGKLRTIAAQGTSDLEARFIDFARLFTFLHLENRYKNQAWVVADGELSGYEVITKLQENFKSWDKEHFLNFSKPQFEDYYPNQFKRKIDEIITKENSQDKQVLKKNLLNEVLQWINTNPDDAKEEFGQSAKEVIEILKSIEDRITNKKKQEVIA